MKIKPLYDRVIILPKVDEINTGGIILPDTAQQRPEFGEIIAVGDGQNPDGENVGMKVKVGEKVIFNKYSGVEVKIEKTNYIIMRQIDIIGVIYD